MCDCETSDYPEVLPIRALKDDGQNAGLHPLLPHSPSLIVCFGSVASGKTSYINNLVLNPNFLRGRMDEVILISPTAGNDPVMRFLKEDPDTTLCEEYSDDFLNAVLQHQMEQDKDERSRLMLIFDDCLAYMKRSGKGSGLTSIATRYRHYGIPYLVYTSQGYKTLDVKIRANMNYIVIFKIPNSKIINDMSDELGAMFNDQFKKLYIYCITNRPYSYMTLDLKTNPPTAILRTEKPIYCGRWLIPEPDIDTNNLLFSNEQIEELNS